MLEPQKVFISYNHKDQEKAVQVLHHLKALEFMGGFVIWFDRHSVQPGELIADKIIEGLQGADYYVILISENSNKSEWVKRELSAAFELSKKKDLALVPVVIEHAEIPLEFRGQLTIDARGEKFLDGLNELVRFFIRQRLPGDLILHAMPHMMWKHDCPEILGELSLGDLRYLLTQRLDVPDIGVLWFDIFGQPLENDVAPTTLAQYCVALLNKSQKTDLISKLYKTLCRNHPRLWEFARKMRET